MYDLGVCFMFCSLCSPSVSGRRPLGLDPVLDYDVMSDEDWEEEVEGESLSQQVSWQEPPKGILFEELLTRIDSAPTRWSACMQDMSAG